MKFVESKIIQRGSQCLRVLLSLVLVWISVNASFTHVLCVREDGHSAIELATETGSCFPDAAEHNPAIPTDYALREHDPAPHPTCGTCEDIVIVKPVPFQKHSPRSTHLLQSVLAICLQSGYRNQSRILPIVSGSSTPQSFCPPQNRPLRI